MDGIFIVTEWQASISALIIKIRNLKERKYASMAIATLVKSYLVNCDLCGYFYEFVFFTNSNQRKA